MHMSFVGASRQEVMHDSLCMMTRDMIVHLGLKRDKQSYWHCFKANLISLCLPKTSPLMRTDTIVK